MKQKNKRNLKKAILLLNEHRSSIREIRVICEKFLHTLEAQIKREDEAVCDISDDNTENITKDKSADKFVDKFNKKDVLKSIIQIGQFITKLLPLEQKLYGTFLVKTDELINIIAKESENTAITEKDIAILEYFLERRKNQSLNKAGSNEGQSL